MTLITQADDRHIIRWNTRYSDKEIERLNARIKELEEERIVDEQRIADLMGDVNNIRQDQIERDAKICEDLLSYDEYDPCESFSTAIRNQLSGSTNQLRKEDE